MVNLASGIGPADQADKVIETEIAALLLSPFVTKEDPEAPGVKYIVAPNGSGSKGGARASYIASAKTARNLMR